MLLAQLSLDRRVFGWGQQGLVTKSGADFVWFELTLLRGGVRNQPAQPQGLALCSDLHTIDSGVRREGSPLG